MITSVKNDKVKSWKKLQKRKERLTTGTFLIEGFHLLEEAYKSGWKINEIIVLESTSIPDWCKEFPFVEVSENVFRFIAQTKSPQGVAAVVEMKHTKVKKGTHFLLVDAIQDPGNLGTIIRTADAAGFDGVILGDGTVDLYNDKVIRATQGSLFHLPILQRNLVDEINELKQQGFTIWATALNNAKKYNQVSVHEKTAIIVGNEGAGVQEEMLNLADELVTIPIYGRAESLNVSIAAGILMYYGKG